MKLLNVYMFNNVNAIRRWLASLSRPSKATNKRRLQERGERIDEFIIRDATTEDITALAALHVQTWNETYRSHYKPGLQLREQQWREQFSKKDDNWFCLLVVNNKGTLIGYAKGIIHKEDNEPGYTGEVNKIYLLQPYQRLGLGKKLLEAVAGRFYNRQIKSMVLFGTPQNPSAAFYEAMGGEKMYSEKGAFHGGYRWKDISKLAGIHTDREQPVSEQ